MAPMLMKMSNSLKELQFSALANFQFSALAKLVLQFDGQLCEFSAEEFTFAGFAEELSLEEIPAAVQEHLDSTAVRLQKVLAAAADLTLFWCVNHRSGSNWSTSEQIQQQAICSISPRLRAVTADSSGSFCRIENGSRCSTNCGQG